MAESASSSSSRLGVKSYHHQMGEIVEVQGGHIVRSTGRKDRHSKVCTAKGPRDRRVRLSAHTAIQFYDVQDRLGYDRPSKAVDWLIKKAKAAIDELDHLPAWNPTANSSPPPQPAPPKPDNPTPPPLQQQHHHQQSNSITASAAAAATSAAALTVPFLPPSLDSDSIADTIKSFFPIVSGGNNHNHHHHDSGIHYNQQHQTRQNQDLRLSLQSLQDPIPMFHHHHHASSNDHAAAMFSAAAGSAAAEASSPLGFGWSDHRISFDGSSSGFGGFNSAAADNNSSSNNNSQLFFSTLQRGPLQSSNTTSVRANWIESQPLSIPDHHHQISQSMIHHHQQHQATSSMPAVGMGMGMGFGVTANSSGGGGGFHYFPARIQGEEEHHHGGADKPSSASSDSRH